MNSWATAHYFHAVAASVIATKGIRSFNGGSMFKSGRRNAILAMTFSAIAGFSSFAYLSGAARPRSKPVREVVVASRDIRPGEIIGEDSIRIREVDAEAVGRYAVADKSEVLNKAASSPIYQGEPILSSRVSSADEGSEASLMIGKGNVAVGLPADAISAVGDGVRPGDRVDIFATVDPALGGKDETVLLMSDVEVIGIGGTYPFGGSEGSDAGSGRSSGGGAVIIEVAREQAGRIIYYSERAKLRLALLPRRDN